MAEIIDGKLVSAHIRERIKKDVKRRYDVKDGNEFFNYCLYQLSILPFHNAYNCL